MKKLFYRFLKNYLRKIIIDVITEDINQDGRLRYLLRNCTPGITRAY